MIEGIAGFLDGIVRAPRSNDFKQFASNEGFEFNEQEPFSNIPFILRDKYIFKKKKGILKRVLHKSLELPSTKLRIYDFINYNDDLTTTTIFEVENINFQFSPFIIYPRGVLSKMKHWFVNQEIVYEELEEFNKKFAINAEQTESMSWLLNRSALEAMVDQKKLYVEGVGDYLIFYIKGKALEVLDLERMYSFVLEFVDRLLFDDSDDFV